MDFPKDFSAQAKARVVAAEINAKRRVSEPGSFSYSGISGITDDPRTWLVFRYIMEVFSVFAHEACELGRKVNGWTADVIDKESRDFLRSIASMARATFDPSEHPVPDTLSNFGFIRPEIQRVFESFPEWRRYQDELLQVTRLHLPDLEPPPSAEEVVRNWERSVIASLPYSPPLQPKRPIASQFQARTAWLKDRLAERAWNRNHPAKHGGPDPKTIDKILAGRDVREDVLEKLATALSKKRKKVDLTEIPRD